FEFLENLEPTFRQELEPTLFSNGRAISSADIYDFLSISIKSGIPSKETSELLELLPKLKEKQEGFKGSLEGQILEETPLTYHTEQSKSIAELRTSLKEALSPYVNKDIVNIATNIKAQISSTGINKIASKKAVDKSINNGFSRDEHFKAGENINKLFENATLKSTKADKNQSPHLRAIYRFDSPLLINNKEANALITLKESIENGKKIYSLELEELSPSSNTQRHTNKEEQGQLMLTKVADMQGETLTTPIAKTDTQIIPQSTTSSQSLELIAGFKNQLVQGLSAFFENTNISKASYEKYRLLGVDKFFSDFDIASIHNLGLNKDYSQIYTGTLQNGKHFELEVQKISPSNNSGLNFHQKVIFKIAKGSGEVEKKLEWIRHYYKTSQKDATLFENGISIELNNGEKNKLLNYKQNAKSAKLEIQTQPLQETLEQNHNLLPDDDFKSFLELKAIGDNPRDREYKGENIYNPQRGIYSTLGFDFNSTKEAKAFIDEAQSELTPKEIELLKDSFKEVEIKTNYADYDGRIGKSYPPYIKLNDEKANAILQYKIKSLGFDENNHFLNLFEKYAKNQNEFLKANGEPFGINFKLAESKDKGKLALKVLSDAKMGQAKGAFFREDLKELSGNGEIDLVWGEVTNPQTHKGYGLAHIIDKHPDFDINLIPEIVERGEVIDDKSALTLWHKGENGEYYKLGISKGFKGDGENHWVITAYEVDRGKDKTFGDTLFTDKHPLPNSNTIIPQSNPIFTPDEMVDADFIAKEPDITKRIEYKRHNQRAKQIQELNAKLEQIDKEATSNLLSADGLEDLMNETKLLEKKKAKLQERQMQSLELKELENKEVKGLYNVAYNGKNAARVFKDLEAVENHIMLFKGYHHNTKNKGKGAKHIKEHFKPFSEGFVSQEEYLNLGKDLRAYLEKYQEPFMEKDANIYEWFNDKGTKFRLVVSDKNSGLGHKSTPPSADDEIITYFSDRFSQKGINFKNPKVQEAYEKDINKKLTIPQIQEKFKKSFSSENQLSFTLDDEYSKYTKPLKQRAELKEAYDNLRNSLLNNKVSKIKIFFNAYQEKIRVYKEAIDNDIAENLNHKNKLYQEGLKKWLGDIHELHPIVRNGKKPKIFYHGSNSNDIEIFIPNSSDGFEKAIWLSPNKEVAHSYGRFDGAVYEVYLKIKNPLIYNAKGKKYKEALPAILQEFKRDYKKDKHDAVVIKNILDGSSKPDTNILVFNPNQIKAVENKGSIPKSKGDFKTATTKDTTKQGFQYFNEQSPNIYHSNPHLGSGLVGGSVAGFETDEQGNLSFNPQNFLLGLAGGAIGSKAVAQGFKALKDNPAFKEKLQQELANTLSRGWESAIKQYPILESLEPRYIIKNEKGREIQAQGILREVEKEQIYSLRESAKQTLSSIVGENIINIHDGRIAQVSKRNIGKMVSDKAIAKSVANGFTAMEHFNAVNDIETLYKNAIFKETTADKHGEIYLKIHRYNAQFENANALITLKETTKHGNKIYTLELEELEAPTKQVHSQAIGEQLSKSRKLEPMHPNTPLENPKSILPQKATQKLKEYIEVKEKIANIESMNFGNNRELRQEINKKGIQNLTVAQYKKQLRNQYGYDTLLQRREELQQEINNFTPQEKNPFTLENFNEDLAEQWIDLVERANVFHIRGSIQRLAQKIKYTQALKDIKALKQTDILKSIKGLDDFVIKQRELFDLESRVNSLKSNFQKISKNETRRRMKENNIQNVSIVDYQKILLEQDQDYLEYKKLLPEYEKKAKKIKSLLDYQPFNLKNWNDEAVEKWVVAIKNHPTLNEIDKNRLIHSLPRMTKDEREYFEAKIADNIQEFLENGYTQEEINIIKEAAFNKNETASIILERYQSVGYGRGYSGYSMSNNAISSYANGEKPISKWNSQDVKEFNAIFGTELTLKEFKDFLLDFGEAGYHHTSSHYNKTKFYSISNAVLYGRNFLL
ncbi:hypothetical protein, partial [Helicobacter apodemus]|uniref:putative barnase/colicin E5 family endoribonuclease n=1 Tax=Helicobacter apodemus TaxID=135569 RepID=UPI00188347BC